MIICLGETRIHQAVVESRAWSGPSASMHLPAPLFSTSALFIDEGLVDHLASASASNPSLNVTTTNHLTSAYGSAIPKFTMPHAPSNPVPPPNFFPRADELVLPMIQMETALLDSPASSTNHTSADGTTPHSGSNGNMIRRSMSVNPPLFNTPLSVPSASKTENSIPSNGFLAYATAVPSLFPSQKVAIPPQIGAPRSSRTLSQRTHNSPYAEPFRTCPARRWRIFRSPEYSYPLKLLPGPRKLY